MEKEQERRPKLTDEQEKLLAELEEQIKKQRKEKRKLPWLMISVIIVLIIGALIASCLSGYVHKPENGSISVHFIDVGQGDCIYISGNGENMLIDCGEASQSGKVTEYLEKQGVKRLDYVVGTHPHSDHMGGMSEIVSRFEIGEFIIPHLDDDDIPTTRYFEKFLDAVETKRVKLTEGRAGRKITFCGGEWEFIAPCRDKYPDMNNYSVGLVFRYGRNSFIFTGDAEAAAEKDMLASGRMTHADVYKVPHHGSNTSSSDGFLEAVRPSVAVISCGEDNSYGHPNKSTLDKLSKYTDKIYRTDISGTIIITSDGEELSVRTERSSR